MVPLLSWLLLAPGAACDTRPAVNAITFPTPPPLHPQLQPGEAGKHLSEGVQAVESVSAMLRDFFYNSSEKNWVVSPLSLAMVLGQLQLGASGHFQRVLTDVLSLSLPGGRMPGLRVHRQLGQLVRYMEEPGAGYELAVNGAFFVQRNISVKQPYKHALFDLYNTDTIPLDFIGDTEGAGRTINEWMQKATRGKISQAPPNSISPLTMVVLANSVYFRGDWETPFDRHLTRPESFFVDKATKVSVPFMSGNVDVRYLDSESSGVTLLGIPYKRSRVIMYVIMARDGNRTVEEVASQLQPADITRLTAVAKVQRVTLVFPRLKIQTTANIGETVKEFVRKVRMRESVGGEWEKEDLAMRSASDDPRFRLDGVLHQAVLEVTERGAEAAAVTSTLTDYFGGVPVVKVNRPFLFFMRHSLTGVDLFWGAVANPQGLTKL